jgi:putative intracellular protease/amidase
MKSLTTLLIGLIMFAQTTRGAPRPPKTVLIPVPHYGFDPTEASVPWKKLADAGFTVVFATPDGKPAEADKRMVTGVDLPALLKGSLMAEPEAVETYKLMVASPEFQHPVAYDQIDATAYDALMLPGGHDKGMREYLESAALQKVVAYFFDHDRPVGAICHGTLLAARSKSVEDPARQGKSVLFGRKTTGLTHNQEMVAYHLTRWSLGDYYRTYPTPMADELVSYLRSSADYSRGPGWPIPMARDSDKQLKHGFTVRDGNYLSARWPGDAHKFGIELVELVKQAR